MSKEKQGRLIVVDASNDRIGKTTFCNKLIKRLEDQGRTVVTKHFPDETGVTGQYIINLLSPDTPVNIKDQPYQFVSRLYIIDFKSYSNWILSELAKGHDVLLDRYYTSTLLYESTIARVNNEASTDKAFRRIEEMALDEFELLPIDNLFLLHADRIIDEFYDNVSAKADNLEGRKFQTELIKTFYYLKDQCDIFKKAVYLNRLLPTGDIVEADVLVEQAVKALNGDC